MMNDMRNHGNIALHAVLYSSTVTLTERSRSDTAQQLQYCGVGSGVWRPHYATSRLLLPCRGKDSLGMTTARTSLRGNVQLTPNHRDMDATIVGVRVVVLFTFTNRLYRPVYS